MIIPPKAIRTLLSPNPILNLSEREINSPEGVGFDLRLSSLHTIQGQGSLLIETRKTPKAEKLEPDAEGIFTLTPNNWYLATTIEEMRLPSNLAGIVFPRSTLFRSGVELHTSITPAGYEGPLTFGLSVHNPAGFRIASGARFCHLVLMQVKKGATKYRGQWNQGRIDSPDEERQI
ncbi:MAG: deoxycytidine deaminase [Gammaproteobacteria bacterium]|nr:deoxycytidine deaminase [Gammaproteobacteria bacterium]MBU1505588.1 deoxycytidine deaminase [Gammaproteobacteria bacterium]MBU2120332.1 deoxycytidine deaminase [Gammaproteobacteria bacterium]MBU2170820.1 deoxycytidine deaminase [Gammaproteobacteria bacterium]MBU2200835.1 deoxycytidine deaminase [Gammaproteobacteria bacterium]